MREWWENYKHRISNYYEEDDNRKVIWKAIRHLVFVVLLCMDLWVFWDLYFKDDARSIWFPLSMTGLLILYVTAFYYFSSFDRAAKKRKKEEIRKGLYGIIGAIILDIIAAAIYDLLKGRLF